MGRAEILSHIGKAKYSVRVEKSLDSISYQLSRMITRYHEVESIISEAEQRMSEIGEELVALQATAEPMVEQYIEARQAWVDLRNNEPKEEQYASQESFTAAHEAWSEQIKALREVMDDIMEKFVEITEAALELQKEFGLSKVRQSHANIDLHTIQGKISEFESIINTEDIRDVWCADLSEELSGVVPSIEINGEPKSIVLAPGSLEPPLHYVPGGSVLADMEGMSVAQAIYSYCIHPAWQRWKPTYRAGRIMAIDYLGDTASVTLDDVVSHYRGAGTAWEADLDINPHGRSLFNVPVYYMDCNALAFDVDDHVIVAFPGQSWDSPCVVGFVEEPQACGECIPATVASKTGTWYVWQEHASTEWENGPPEMLSWRIVGDDGAVFYSGGMDDDGRMIGLPKIQVIDPKWDVVYGPQRMMPGTTWSFSAYQGVAVPQYAGGIWRIRDHTYGDIPDGTQGQQASGNIDGDGVPEGLPNSITHTFHCSSSMSVEMMKALPATLYLQICCTEIDEETGEEEIKCPDKDG